MPVRHFGDRVRDAPRARRAGRGPWLLRRAAPQGGPRPRPSVRSAPSAVRRQPRPATRNHGAAWRPANAAVPFPPAGCGLRPVAVRPRPSGPELRSRLRVRRHRVCSSSSARAASVARRESSVAAPTSTSRRSCAARRGQLFELDSPAPFFLGGAAARPGARPRAVAARSRPRLRQSSRATSAASACVGRVGQRRGRDDRRTRRTRHATRTNPPKRSPSRVTATTPGFASATSSACSQPPSTSTNWANKRAEHRVEPGAQTAHRRTERMRSRGRERDLHAGRAALGDEQQRLAVAALQALDRGAGRIVAVDHDRFRARRRARRQLRSRNRRRSRAGRRVGPSTPFRPAMSSPPAAACASSSASASISARARQRDASLSALRWVSSASRSASSAARSSRAFDSQLRRDTGIGLDLGPRPIGLGLGGVGFLRARFERGPVAIDRRQLRAHPGELGRDRTGARGHLLEVVRGALELAFGHRNRHDAEGLDAAPRPLRLRRASVRGNRSRSRLRRAGRARARLPPRATRRHLRRPPTRAHGRGSDRVRSRG